MPNNNIRSARPVSLPPPPVPGSAAPGLPTDAEALLQALPWGVVVLDAQGTVRYLNQQAAHWWGAPAPTLLGQPLGPATAGTLPPDLQQALRQVAGGPALPPAEFFLPQQQQWLAMTSVRRADTWVVYWQDVTAQKQRELQYQALALNTPDLLLRWDGDLRLLYANRPLPRPAGPAYAAQPIGPGPALELAADPDGTYQAALRRVFATGQPQAHYSASRTPQGQVYYQTLLVPELRDGSIETVLSIARDVTALKQAEQALQAEHRHLQAAQARQAASDTLLRRTEVVARTGSYELELATGQFQFSDGLFRLFGVEPGAFPLDLAFINSRSHPDDVAAITQLLAQASTDGQPYHYQRRIYRPDGQPRTLEAHGRVERDAQGQPAKLLGLVQDVTERRQAAQDLLQVKDELAQHVADSYVALYNSIDEGFCIVEVLFDEAQQPVDYRFLDVNPAFEKQTGLRGVLGQTIRELVPAIEQSWPDAYGRVALTGEPVRFEANVESMGRWFDINAFSVGLVENRRVAVLFTDITERKHTEEALRQSEEQFRLLATVTFDTVYRMSADWTRMEQLIGKDFLANTLSPTRTWMEEYLLADDLPQVQAAIAEAIARKSSFELEHRVRRADGTAGWVYSRAIPVLGAAGNLTGWVGAASDVSARKEAEQQLLEFNARLEQQVIERTRALGESQARLQSVFDSVTTAIVLLRAVRDATGHLLDFEYVLVNSVAQGYNVGQPLVGQRYSKLHPGVHLTSIFKQFVAVVETNRRADFEVYYDHEQFNHWFRLVAVQVGDGLLYTSEDITARKLLEQGQAQSLALLLESEAVAGLGSWAYDLATHALTWSNGLYHLLGRPVGSPVEPQLFLDAVLDDDRPVAARLLRALATGHPSFDAQLRLRVGEAVKTVRFKAVAISAASALAGRVLGVCLDVSDVARLEAENLALKLDQHKELLLAILQAQEDERQRLAEVLHNSLGQVLYATKLHLDQLDTPALHALPALAALHQQTGRLLSEAMRQTRTLAHELVPTSLASFGLAVAVRDICRDLSTPQLRLECQVWGEAHELPQPVQITLFRLAQELTHNIVRHAGATQALLELETLPRWVSLRAEDNGRGFDPLTVAEGLGLRTMRNAVALLGGTVTVDSSPEFGTHIRLRIPLPLFS